MKMTSNLAWSLWECLFCLLPSMVLCLLALASSRPRVRFWLKLGIEVTLWRVWMATCWVLELPPPRVVKVWPKRSSSPARVDASVPDLTSERPSLICKPTALSHYLLKHWGSLAQPRLATWPKGDPHIQTLSSLLWGEPGGGQHWEDTLHFTRDHLLLRDGGIVALDWAVGSRGNDVAVRDREDARKERHVGSRALGCHMSTPPVLILIPHSWGGVTPHLKRLCRLALQQGFSAVVVNPRGTAGCPLTTPRLAEFGDPSDLEQAVAYVRSRHPSSVLLAVSEGSGSGVLLSYLGECGSSSFLKAAAAISPVLQGQLWYETAIPIIYRWGALLHRKLQLSRYASSFRAVIDVDRALGCSSLRDFEESLFCSQPLPEPELQRVTPHDPTGIPSSARPKSGSASPTQRVPGPSMAWALGERGYPAKDWDSYWERNEPLRDADDVAVPLLCLRSYDDPLLPPASTLPLHLFQSHPFFLLVMTQRGGHCGFTLEERDEEGSGIETRRTGKGNVEESTWSHVAILEYFRVVAEFLKGEERNILRWDGGTEDRGQGQRQRSKTFTSARRKRRGTVARRSRPQTGEQSSDGGEDVKFTWKRCNTN